MNRLAQYLVVLVATTGTANAQASAAQLARCAALPANDARLRCYDELADAPTAQATVEEEELPDGTSRIGRWLVSTSTDPISDVKGVTFMLPADDARSSRPPAFMIRCQRGTLDAFVSPGEYLGRGNNRVTLRLGNGAPLRQTWSASANHSALFVPGNRASVEGFIRDLAVHDRFVIQVSPYNKAPMAIVFSLEGIEGVSQELWQVCRPSRE